MSLPAGKYRIISQVGDRPVGRFLAEDLSFRPKRVAVLPKDFPKPRIWHIEPLANGKYKFTTGGDVVGTKPDDLVWAFLIPQEIQGAEWRLTHAPQHGKHAYLIQTADESDGKGWVASEEDNAQIAIWTLIQTPSIPPRYPLQQVFNIVRVPDFPQA